MKKFLLFLLGCFSIMMFILWGFHVYQQDMEIIVSQRQEKQEQLQREVIEVLAAAKGKNIAILSFAGIRGPEEIVQAIDNWIEQEDVILTSVQLLLSWRRPDACTALVVFDRRHKET